MLNKVHNPTSLAFSSLCLLFFAAPVQAKQVDYTDDWSVEPVWVDSIDDLASKTSEWFQSARTDATAVTVREFRRIGHLGNYSEQTKQFADALAGKGFIVSQDGDIELYVTIVKNEPNAFSLRVSDASSVYAFPLKLRLTTRFAESLGLSEPPKESQRKPSAGNSESSGKELKPVRSWHVARMSWTALNHAQDNRADRTGIISDAGKWSNFWTSLKTGGPTPTIDFTKRYILILYAKHPSSISYRIFAKSAGAIEITRTDSEESVSTSAPLDAYILEMETTPSQSPSSSEDGPKLRLGLSAARSADGSELSIVRVFPNSAATRGQWDDGTRVTCEVGDRIVSVDDEPINDPDALSKAVRQADSTLVLYIRDKNTGAIRRTTFFLD